MDKYLNWDEYFMGIAILSSKRSKDPKTKVGCCIVDPDDHRIVSIGYNGFPRNIYDDPAIWETDEKHKYVIHAEINALLNAREPLNGKVLYVSMFPCNECAKAIIQSGIAAVIFNDDKYRFKDAGVISEKLLLSAGIKIVNFKTGEVISNE